MMREKQSGTVSSAGPDLNMFVSTDQENMDHFRAGKQLISFKGLGFIFSSVLGVKAQCRQAEGSGSEQA